MKEIKGKFYTLHHVYDNFYTSSMATSKRLPLRLFSYQLHVKVPWANPNKGGLAFDKGCKCINK
jgi:hypothetical protein